MVAFAVLLWTAAAVSQTVPASSTAAQPPATGLIVGRVVDASSGRPVAGAIVTLDGGAIGLPVGIPSGRSMPRALTSGSGQFVFRKLAKGSYQLRATRAGYADGAYGQRRPGGVSASLTLDEGQRVGDAVIPIWKHATISGTVVDEAGEPLVGVQLRAFVRRYVGGQPRLAQAGMTATDDRGFYRFGSLVPGDYFVAFVWREASVPVSVADAVMNQPMNDTRNQDLMRERMIVGSSFAASGSPSAIAVGDLLRDLAPNGPVPPAGSVDGPLFIYPTQFYPGMPSAARARAITLGSGESRESIDFALQPVRTAHVSGTVVGPDGPIPNIAVRLVPANDESLTELETSATMTGSGGEFTLLGVPAGQYTITVLRQPSVPTAPASIVTTQIQVGSSTMMTSSGGSPNTPPSPVPDDPTFAADVPVSVGEADVNAVVVSLQRAARLTGRFEFDGTAQKPDTVAMQRIYVTLGRADGVTSNMPFMSFPNGHADESGLIKTSGIPPGKYVLRVSAADGWALRSAAANGRDLADAPFDVRTADINDVVITFTDRPTKLTGSVRAPNGNPDSSALVVIFPADASSWTDAVLSPRRIRSTRTDRNGSYTLAALPAGEYYVAAIREETTPQWQDPQTLEDLARSATQVRLAEGETRAQDLKSAGGGL